MKKTLLLLGALALTVFTFNVQASVMPADTGKAAAAATPAPTPDPPLVFSGSVDTYYKYDFSGHGNIPTSFANDQNSASIGMIDLGLKKKVGKSAFVGELSFGPRGQYQSIPNGDGSNGNFGNSFHIQNLYVSYDLTDKLNVTAGYMSTFIGYEVISPAANFNYSTSYLFTTGPFQNAGLKATYAFSDKASLMVGVFNDNWNVYTSNYNTKIDNNGGITLNGDVSTIGAQLTLTPIKNWTAYLNVAVGPISGTIFDLTTTYQITDAFKLGLNVATYSTSHLQAFGTNLITDPSIKWYAGYDGVAIYPQLAVSKSVTLGLREEYFEFKNGYGNVIGSTLTANIKAGPLTIIPEFRIDSRSDKFASGYFDSNNKLTNSANQFLLAAVYAF